MARDAIALCTRLGPVGLTALLLTLFAGLPACVPAQQIPPAEAGNRSVNVNRVNDRLEMRDARSNNPILLPKCFPLYDDYGTGLRPTIDLRPQPNGTDIVLTFTNTTGRDVALGRVRLGTFTLGPDITYQQFWGNCGDVQANVNSYVGNAWVYPDSLYSPVFVIRNPNIAVGLSVLYPVMEYKHDVYIGLNSIGSFCAEGEGGRGWEMEVRFSSAPQEPEGFFNRIRDGAVLPNGQTRTYVLALRTTSNTNEWIRTLAPYAAYFRQQFGGVRYQRQTTPVMAITMADDSNLSDENPRGFGFPSRRPDVHGWGPWMRYMRAVRGWPAIMLWTPSGIYRNNRHNNFPPQFVTGWRGNEKLMTGLDPQNGLPGVGASGKQLGLWWGRSAQVARVWDQQTLEPFNPDNPEHVRIMFDELDMAVAAGAALIGLDAFDHHLTPAWKQYDWLQTMQRRHPNVRFIVEPISCDFLHTLAGTFIEGFLYQQPRPQSIEEFYTIRNPHYLADLLVPGHETWGVIGYVGHVRYGYAVTPELVQRDVERYAAFGYRPVAYISEPLNRVPTVAESWLMSIPADMRQPSSGAPSGGPTSGQGSGQQGSGQTGGQGGASGSTGQGGASAGVPPPGTPGRFANRTSRRSIPMVRGQSTSRRTTQFFSRSAVARALAAAQNFEAIGPERPAQASVPTDGR